MGDTLIIWEEIPEQTLAYIVPANSKIGKLASCCAGQYINLNAEEGGLVYLLSDLLEAAEDERLGVDEEIIGPFDNVIVCGIVV